MDFWGINSLYETFPDKPWDCWFHLHPHHEITQADWKWLIAFSSDAYLIEASPMAPAAKRFPREDIMRWWAPYNVFEKDIEEYWTSSMHWMLGFAIMLGYEEIHLYGIDLVSNIEYRDQRAGVEGMLRFHQGRGGKVVLPKDTALFKTSWIYGVDKPDVSEARRVITDCREGIRTAMAKREENLAHAHTQQGAMLAYRQIIQKAKLREREAGVPEEPLVLSDYTDDLEGIAEEA